jgi:hypothetical protein
MAKPNASGDPGGLGPFACSRQLAARRHALVAQAALLRARAADSCAQIRRALGWAERGVGLVRGAARKPLVVGLAAAALAVLIAKPRQAATWLSYGLTAYTVLRRIQRALAMARRTD